MTLLTLNSGDIGANTRPIRGLMADRSWHRNGIEEQIPLFHWGFCRFLRKQSETFL